MTSSDDDIGTEPKPVAVAAIEKTNNLSPRKRECARQAHEQTQDELQARTEAERVHKENAALPKDDSAQDKDDKQKLADVVIDIVCKHANLFHDKKQTAFAVVQTDRRAAVLRLNSQGMKFWVARTVRDTLGHSVGQTSINEALVTLGGIAIYDRQEREVFLRTAQINSTIYVDIGDATGECIEVTGDGWRIVPAAPVMFFRPDAMRPIPRPATGGSLDDFRAFFNMSSDDALHLLIAWAVAAMRPGMPFVILILTGEQGSAKSTAAMFLRALIDGNAAPLRSPPKDIDDLTVGASHSLVAAYDNLSGVAPWLADGICRLATGGGLGTRTLYTNGEETVFDAIRPVLINGIDELATRPDLAERSICLTLRAIPAKKRRPISRLRREFATAAPRMLGVLLDGVSAALRNLPSIHLDEHPRMADFAEWIAAAEAGLRVPPGSLLAAYARNRQTVVDTTLSSSPLIQALRKLITKPVCAGRWEGEPSQLLRELGDNTDEETRHQKQTWPQSPQSLRSKLRRSQAFLRTIGIEIELDGKVGDWNVYTIRTVNEPERPDPPTTLPAVPEPGSFGEFLGEHGIG